MNDINPNSSPKRTPIIFVGHGNPMYAIEKNDYSDTWRSLGETLPKPRAILCISAHWETHGIKVTAMPQPKTIHDFGGFPQALFDVQYPAKGSPELASEIIQRIKSHPIELDMHWGLDHGCWSVLRCMYPQADVPIVQLSLDRTISSAAHYAFAKDLLFLRTQGVMIVGSGNMVHNLRLVEWENKGGAAWAISANDILKELIVEDNHPALIDYINLGKDVQLAINSAEHYLPMLYILALKQAEETISFFNDSLEMGSLSMTSFFIDGK